MQHTEHDSSVQCKAGVFDDVCPDTFQVVSAFATLVRPQKMSVRECESCECVFFGCRTNRFTPHPMTLQEAIRAELRMPARRNHEEQCMTSDDSQSHLEWCMARSGSVNVTPTRMGCGDRVFYQFPPRARSSLEQ